MPKLIYGLAKFSNKNGSLKYLGLYGGYYYMILKNSGYLYIYAPPQTNKNSRKFLGKGNKLNILDPRGNTILYIAECSNLRN